MPLSKLACSQYSWTGLVMLPCQRPTEVDSKSLLHWTKSRSPGSRRSEMNELADVDHTAASMSRHRLVGTACDQLGGILADCHCPVNPLMLGEGLRPETCVRRYLRLATTLRRSSRIKQVSVSTGIECSAIRSVLDCTSSIAQTSYRSRCFNQRFYLGQLFACASWKMQQVSSQPLRFT